MGGRGSVSRMRLTAYGDLASIFFTPTDKEGKQTGPVEYRTAAFEDGKGVIDDLVLVGGLKFRVGFNIAVVYTKPYPGKDESLHNAFKSQWKRLVNDCHARNIEVCIGLAPQPKTGDGEAFQTWLFNSDQAARGKLAASIKQALDEDLPGSSGVSFDCEYLFTGGKTNNIPSQMTDDQKTRYLERRDKLTDFYYQVADAIAPLRVVAITGAKSGHIYTDEHVEASDHSLLHDWPALGKKSNILIGAMAYMYTPKPPRTFESWHRAVMRYATMPEPSGYEEDRAHLPVGQFQLIVQVANTAKAGDPPSVGIVTDRELRHRGYLSRLFGVGYGLFPIKTSSYAGANELLNKRPGVRPDDSSGTADPAPPPGTANQPVQMPVRDPATAFKKV